MDGKVLVRQGRPDDDDRSALSAVTRDRRMSRIGGLNMLWRGRPDLVALPVEPILTRLAWPVSDPYATRTGNWRC